ncbi:MAG TPA: Rieske 2Fe-2S domain-containing protein [Alphaproteobacteria bacterium]|jgi:nitrite reductase/ring-hydroxylating ferredoxin subunit
MSGEWQRLDGVDLSKAGFPVRAKVGAEAIVIFRTGTGYRGVQRLCPHQRAPLTNGVISANGTMIRCPQHNYMFRLTDGKGVNCPGYKIAVYEVKEEGGAAYARPVT